MTPSEAELPPVPPSRAERGLSLVAIVGLYAMAVLITTNVISRWIGRAIIPDDIELVKELMVLVILLPLGVVTAQREHISVDVLTNGVSLGAKRLLSVLGHVVGLVFGGFLAWAGWNGALGAWRSQDYYPGDLEIPMWIGQTAFLVGVVLFLARLVYMLWRDLRGPA